MADVLGIIGAVTGIAGAIMGAVAYRQVNKIKALDLRVELRKLKNELQLTTGDLVSHLEHARKSRRAVSSALGSFRSGAMTRWQTEWEADLAVANQLTVSAVAPADYQKLSQSELEAALGEMHACLGEVRKLREKYDACIVDDNQRRSELREAAAARFAPKNTNN